MHALQHSRCSIPSRSSKRETTVLHSPEGRLMLPVIRTARPILLRSILLYNSSSHGSGCAHGGDSPARHGSNGSNSSPSSTQWYLAPTEPHLQYLAAFLAADRRPGDCYCLHGAVGAGKSSFSRAFIRAAAQDPQLQVPSPTYLLQIIYDEHEGPPIHHFDLYRLEQHPQQQHPQQQQQQSVARLDLPHSFQAAVSLIEWAERLPHSMMPQDRLEVTIEALPADSSSSSSSNAAASAPYVSQHPQQQGTGGASAVIKPLPGSSSNPQAQLAAAPAVDTTAADAATAAAAAAAGEAGGVVQQQQLPVDAEAWYGGDDDDDDEPDLFTDRRCRRVVLKAYGQQWAQRLQQLAAVLQQQQQQQQQVR